MKTFISYSRPDRDAAATLAQILLELGVEVWWDQQLTSGQTFNKVIDSQIRAADAVIVLWSPESVDSTWVINEATLALDLGKIYPVRISRCSPRVPFYGIHTPEVLWDISLRRFSGVQALIESLRLGTKTPLPGSSFGLSPRDLSATPARSLLIQVLRKLTIEQIYQRTSNSAEASWLFGTALLEGISSEKNEQVALSYFEAAARAGFIRATNSLGAVLLDRQSRDEVALGLSYVRSAASAGVAIAQFNLGRISAHGALVEKDLVKAFQFFHSAALGGSVDAMDALATCYYRGEGTLKDLKESYHWFKVAADSGHAGAICMMGALAADGELPGAGYREAASLFQAAYAAGYSSAANHLGDLYSDQRFDTYNPGLALHWYSTFGRTGKAGGYHSAANLILNARGRLDHLGDTRMLLAQAADLGDMHALLRLAGLMERGEYGEKDLRGACDAYAQVSKSNAIDQQGRNFAALAVAGLMPNNSKVGNR